MAIYEFKDDEIVPLEETSFENEGIMERGDLQRLLKSHIEIICPNSLVIKERFREWEDSKREIDILAVDEDANLVVIELKRTEDGGHAELQAIRYAAMVSPMTFERAVEVYKGYLQSNSGTRDAERKLLEFLGWEKPDEDRFAQDVRIVLVASDFSKELTTSVLWLNDNKNLDIRCVRMRPHKDGERLLVDVQQIIPLPETKDFTVRLKEKAVVEYQERSKRSGEAIRLEFWKELLKRCTEITPNPFDASPSDINWIVKASGIGNVRYYMHIQKSGSRIELCFEDPDAAINKKRYDLFYKHHEELNKAFGSALSWERNADDIVKSSINKSFDKGGYRNDIEQWPDIQDQMINSMIRLQDAVKPYLEQLRKVES